MAKENDTKSEDERSKLLKSIWGKRGVKRLGKLVGNGFCGPLTVREFVAIVIADNLNFPRGIDTPMIIGDFEGNFWANILSVATGGPMEDHVCVMGG